MSRCDLRPEPKVRLAHAVLEVTQFEGRKSPPVAPHAGAWIETLFIKTVEVAPCRAPRGRVELIPKSVVANFATTASDGKTYRAEYFNLDVIIAVGIKEKRNLGADYFDELL